MLTPDSAPTTDLIQAMLKIPAEHLVLRISFRIFPNRSNSSNQPRNPIGSLYGLITVAFQMERLLDQTSI